MKEQKYDKYITLFLYLKDRYDESFVKFVNDEDEEEKEEIIRFFSKTFKDYKFKFSAQHTAFFYKVKIREEKENG
jgi:hypothetical protein